MCECVLDVQTTRLETLEHSPLVMVSSHLHHSQQWIYAVSDVVMCVLIVCIKYMRLCVLGCTDNDIGDVGAQYIGDGLKSLTSLTTLDLSSE